MDSQQLVLQHLQRYKCYKSADSLGMAVTQIIRGTKLSRSRVATAVKQLHAAGTLGRTWLRGNAYAYYINA